MDTAIDGILLVSAVFTAFGVLAIFAAIFEYVLDLIALRRRNRRSRERLPDPNPRTVVRRAGWNVPL